MLVAVFDNETAAFEGLGGTAIGALIGGLAGLPAGPLAATIEAAGGAVRGRLFSK
jgi:hypothetical protein